jgi:DNA (cytosine-5)-methyltransferase 1
VWPVVGWRLLDSRFFGVPQRRRRIYVVGGPTEDGVRTILSLWEGGPRHPQTRRQARTDTAYALAAGAGSGQFGSGRGNQETFVTHTLTGDQGFDASEDGTGRGTPLVYQCHGNNVGPMGTLRQGRGDVQSGVPFIAAPLTASYGKQIDLSDQHGGPPNLIAFDPTQLTHPLNRTNLLPGDPSPTLPAYGDPILLAATLNSGGNDGGFRTEPGEHLVVEPRYFTRGEGGPPSAVVPTLKTHQTGGLGDAEPLIVQQAVSAKWAKGTSGPSGDECHNMVVADPISASEGRTYSHEGKNNFRMHNVVAVQEAQSGVRYSDAHSTLDAHNGSRRHNGVHVEGAIRRLTPLECERLQGFPDGWTCLCTPLEGYAADPDAAAAACTCPDSPRYRALGNAVTTTVITWLGENLNASEDAEATPVHGRGAREEAGRSEDADGDE